VDEQGLRLVILKLALIFCFAKDEESLSLSQLIERRLTPLEAFTRTCINELINNGAVELVDTSCVATVGEAFNEVQIIRFVQHGEDVEQFVNLTSRDLVELIAASPKFEKCLQEFLNDTQACECIEYSLYYGKKADINIIESSMYDVKLRMLFIKCCRDKINMLLWRAIKTVSKSCSPNSDIPFSKITDAAFDYYIGYASANIEIERYHRPKILKPSMLAGILEIFCIKE
jgi:hypothetical protein